MYCAYKYMCNRESLLEVLRNVSKCMPVPFDALSEHVGSWRRPSLRHRSDITQLQGAVLCVH